MVSGGTAYVQIEYTTNGSSWFTLTSSSEVNSGSTTLFSTNFSENTDVEYRYRVSKYNGVFDPLPWSEAFGFGNFLQNLTTLNSGNCS